MKTIIHKKFFRNCLVTVATISNKQELVTNFSQKGPGDRMDIYIILIHWPQGGGISQKTGSCHNDNFVIIGGTADCHNNNTQCR